MFPLGDYDDTETVVIPFSTFSSDDPAASVTIANLVAGDIEIHKDGSVTQRLSDNGVLVSVDFDGVTGNHIVSIDLSDNSDAGFYAAGSRYQVRMEGTTIDGATINAWIGTFSIGCTLRPTTAGRTLDVNAAGEAGLDLDNTSGTIAAAQLGADCITNAKIADDAIAVENIKDDALAAAKFATGALSEDAFAANALVAATFAASSLDGKGDWNTVTPDAAGTAPTAGEISDTTWDEATAGHIGANSFGKRIADIINDTNELQTNQGAWATATGFSSHTAANVKSAIEAGGSHLAVIKAVTDVLPDSGALTTIAADAARLTAERAAVLTDWINLGRLDTILDAIPTTAMRGTNGANTTVPDAAGIAATPAEVAAALTAIHLDHLLAVDYDPASKPGEATALLNELVENDGGVSRFTQNALEANAATINAEVVDALNVDTYAEPGQGKPNATLSLVAKISYLFKAWRNQSKQSTAQYELYDDTAATIDQKAAVSHAASVATKGEMASGP